MTDVRNTPLSQLEELIISCESEVAESGSANEHALHNVIHIAIEHRKALEDLMRRLERLEFELPANQRDLQSLVHYEHVAITENERLLLELTIPVGRSNGSCNFTRITQVLWGEDFATDPKRFANRIICLASQLNIKLSQARIARVTTQDSRQVYISRITRGVSKGRDKEFYTER